MPKLPINFQNTIIYKLCCFDPDVKEIYIGYSTQLTVRKGSHKASCNNPTDNNHNYKVYQYIRANGGWNNWDMVLVEKYPCNDKLEAKQREQFYISNLHSTLNSINSIQSETYHQEYRETHIKESADYRNTHVQEKKEWYRVNKEEILKKHKEYTSNPDVKLRRAEYKKRYKIDNKERLDEQARDLYIKKKETGFFTINKDHLNEQRRILYAKKKALKLLQTNAEIIS